MPVVTPEQAPTFDTGGAIVTGLAAPSRGSTETCAWRVRFDAAHVSPRHALDRDEIFVVLSGGLTARYDDGAERAPAGGALIVPAGLAFELVADDGGPTEAVCALPAGAVAEIGGETLIPPWAR